MRALILLTALAGCAATGSPDSKATAELDRELATRVAGEPETCISPRGPGSLTPVNATTVTYRDGATLYVNRLRAQCPGLSAYDRLMVESHGGQFCRGDQIRALEPTPAIPGPPCILGDFVPYRPRG